ncbi:MAG: DUF3078 domain-containing protein [Myxococcales bacterium]|nr:DUF3078 domain-containing protein [Myxococcales bacterium]
MHRVCALSLALALAPTLAAAQDDQPDFVPGKDVADAVAKKDGEKAAAAEKEGAQPDGWQLALSLGLNSSFGHSSDVVGQPDGGTLQFGLVIDGSADYRKGQHDWQNALTITHQQTKTPAIDPFVKTGDEFNLRSIYLYELADIRWLGPFARARFQTALLPGYLVRGEDARVRLIDVDGNATSIGIAAQENYPLTSAFEPFVMRQSAGAFARPYDMKTLKLLVTAGLGAQEVITQGGRAVTDDDTTPAIEVTELSDSQQLGAEVEVDVSGAYEERLTWGANANVLFPFLTNADTDLEGLELTNVELGLRMGYKLAKWASLDYVLSAKRLPLIVDVWQVQNNLLLSAAFNLL